MSAYTATPTGDYGLTLGEGPMWDPVRREVSVVDIFERVVYRFAVVDGGLREVAQIHTQAEVGAALPLDDGRLLTCERNGVFLHGPQDSREKVCDLPVTGPDFRPNDAKIGPDGHLWMGVMDDGATEGRASLWRVSARGHSQCLLSGLTIPNGMDWWGDEFWFVNGPDETIGHYRFDDRGVEKTRQSIATRGTPDGLTIDSEGLIWLALWGEGRVDRFNQTGEIVDWVAVASPHSTSVAFIGEALDTVVITSAQFAMAPEALQSTPHAGDIFLCPVEATGRLPHRRFR